MSALASNPTRERRQRPARGRGAPTLGGRGEPVLRLRTIRRTEPDVAKLVELVLNITQTRYDAYRNGQPDPYDLPVPENLSLMSEWRGRVDVEQTPQRRSTQ